MLLIRNRMTMTPKPTKIQISKMCEMPNILPPLSTAPQQELQPQRARRYTKEIKSTAFIIFASFLGLPDCVQVVHDPLRFSVAEKYFSFRQHDANTRVTPNVSPALANAANPVAVERIPGRYGIRLDVLQRNGTQTEA